jgi:SulP family sulfate permease
MAALTGLMIMVAIGTFEWASLKLLIKCLNQIFCHACRDTCNYHLHNLALAVIVGVIVSALVLLGITQNVFGRKTIRTRD